MILNLRSSSLLPWSNFTGQRWIYFLFLTFSIISVSAQQKFNDIILDAQQKVVNDERIINAVSKLSLNQFRYSTEPRTIEIVDSRGKKLYELELRSHEVMRVEFSQITDKDQPVATKKGTIKIVVNDKAEATISVN